MDKSARKFFRCAIYTRKSTDHNLDLEFNSLDAQREACEAYIKSQAHEGWRLIPDRYDDGAFSGASLDRPALQQLLSEVRSGKIDVVVVYKVDRLTRALADFAKLVELFDRHLVSFVSVTQSFNTTSSMGRLTLNVLLSFAQFEREVIGERVRDKIAASKRKGLWVGGPIPLGYASIGKKLVIVPEEAETVRLIFSLYLEFGAVRLVAEELDGRGVRTKRQALANGRIRGDGRFGVGSLANLLRNRFYIGEVVYRGEIHPGEHEPILDRALFEGVQAKLANQAVARSLRLKGSSAILAGRLFDDSSNRMTPTHANKRGVRYRYYVSHPLLQNRSEDAGSVRRVSAPDIERIVLDAVREHIENRTARQEEGSLGDRELIDEYVERIILKPNSIDILIRQQSEPDDAGQPEYDCTPNPDAHEGARTVIALPWSPPTSGTAKGILHEPSSPLPMSPDTREDLLTAIGKARHWMDDLVNGRAASFAEIAKRENRVERHVRFLAPLAFLSPRIIRAIIGGNAPPSLTVTGLAKALPYSWVEQERRIGLLLG
jgi:site-specific DNA recombinase